MARGRMLAFVAQGRAPAVVAAVVVAALGVAIGLVATSDGPSPAKGLHPTSTTSVRVPSGTTAPKPLTAAAGSQGANDGSRTTSTAPAARPQSTIVPVTTSTTASPAPAIGGPAGSGFGGTTTTSTTTTSSTTSSTTTTSPGTSPTGR